MKYRVGIIVLIVICLGLGVGLISLKKSADTQQAKDGVTITTFSNDLAATTSKLEEQKQVSTMLEKDLDTQKKSYVELTNKFTDVTVTLAQTEATLKAAKEAEAKLEAKAAELEGQNHALDKRSQELSASITNLNIQIAETEKKLAASEGSRELLEKELKRLMGEKAELERQFNDLTVLRAQVAKLKEELSIARRMEWIRQGLFASADQKGAQKLMQGVAPVASKPPAKPGYDLNVEVSADGSVRVVPPATNSPANPAAPK
jgi:chromosome segregation ATPase